MRKKGFTLAEVLITLVIIGVIAALTIPTLLNNKEKQETVTGLKEANAILANAVSMAKLEYGDPSTWNYMQPRSDFAKQYLTPYLKVGKVCGSVGEDVATGCFDGPNGGWYDIAGNPDSVYAGGYTHEYFYKFILQNGMAVALWRSIDLPAYSFATILVDVNGAKGPTKIGRDIFAFTIAKDYGFSIGANLNEKAQINEPRAALLVAGAGTCSTGAWPTDLQMRGTACGIVILKDGWQIKDDYPW